MNEILYFMYEIYHVLHSADIINYYMYDILVMLML